MIIDGVQYASHCAACNKGFDSRKSYLQHKKDVHGHACSMCSLSFKKPFDLDNHMKVKHGATFKCLQCNTFGSSAWAQSHAMTARCSRVE